MLHILPDEVITFIFSFLEQQTLPSYSLISKKFTRLWHPCITRLSHLLPKYKTSIVQLESLLTKFTQLQYIDCSNCPCLNDGFIAKMVKWYQTRLKSLNISGNHMVSHQSVKLILKKCKLLEELDISGCQKLKPKIVTVLKGISHSRLEKLNVTDLDVDFQQVMGLLRNPNYPSLQCVSAGHLARGHVFDKDEFLELLEMSPKSAQCIYDYAFWDRCERALVTCSLEMEFPSQQVINDCCLKGNHISIAVLRQLKYPIDNIPVEIVIKTILNDHHLVIKELKTCNYSR